MTYDVAVWKHTGPLSNEQAAAEFNTRVDASERQWDEGRLDPIGPELKSLLSQLRGQFGEEIWEQSDDDADGDFIYLTMPYSIGPQVEAAIVEIAPSLGLVVYSPMSEQLLRPAG